MCQIPNPENAQKSDLASFFEYLSQSEKLSDIKLPLGRYERESTIIILFMISRDRLAISQSSNTRLVKKCRKKGAGKKPTKHC